MLPHNALYGYKENGICGKNASSVKDIPNGGFSQAGTGGTGKVLT